MAAEGNILTASEIFARIRPKRVRYGRSTIGISRTGNVIEGELGKTICRFRAHETSVEEVCWSLVCARISDPSPTFQWEDSELPKLSTLVVASADDLKPSSLELEDVADAVLSLAESQDEFGRKAQELVERFSAGSELARISKAMQPPDWRGFAPALDIKKFVRPTAFESITQGLSRGYLGASNATVAKALSGIAVSPAFDIKMFLPRGIDLASTLAPFNRPGITPVFDSIRRSIEWLKTVLPVNWRQLDSGQVDAVVSLMEEEGLCLAWVAPGDVVSELVSCPSLTVRLGVLVENADAIVESATVLTKSINDESLVVVRDGIIDAIRAFEYGLPGPALSHICVALSHITGHEWAFPSNGACRTHFNDVDPRTDVGIRHYSLYAAGRVLARSLTRYTNAPVWFVPEVHLNRNLTLHQFGPHYNTANFLNGLMLAVALCCEAERGVTPLL